MTLMLHVKIDSSIRPPEQRSIQKFSEKNYKFQNSHRIGYLTKLYLMYGINYRQVICPIAELLVDRGSFGIESKFSHGSTKEI